LCRESAAVLTRSTISWPEANRHFMRPARLALSAVDLVDELREEGWKMNDLWWIAVGVVACSSAMAAYGAD